MFPPIQPTHRQRHCVAFLYLIAATPLLPSVVRAEPQASTPFVSPADTKTAHGVNAPLRGVIRGRYYEGMGLSPEERGSAAYFAGMLGDQSAHLGANPRWARSEALIKAGDVLAGLAEGQVAVYENAIWVGARMATTSKGDLDRARAGQALGDVKDIATILGTAEHDLEYCAHPTPLAFEIAKNVGFAPLFIDLRFKQLRPRPGKAAQDFGPSILQSLRQGRDLYGRLAAQAKSQEDRTRAGEILAALEAAHAALQRGAADVAQGHMGRAQDALLAVVTDTQLRDGRAVLVSRPTQLASGCAFANTLHLDIAQFTDPLDVAAGDAVLFLQGGHDYAALRVLDARERAAGLGPVTSALYFGLLGGFMMPREAEVCAKKYQTKWAGATGAAGLAHAHAQRLLGKHDAAGARALADEVVDQPLMKRIVQYMVGVGGGDLAGDVRAALEGTSVICASCLQAMSNIAVSGNEIEIAVDCLELALARSPSQASALRSLVTARRLRDGHADEELVAEAQKLDPNNPRDIQLLGDLGALDLRTDFAHSTINILIEPRCVTTRYNIALRLLKEGFTKEALHEFDGLVRAWDRHALGHCNRAVALAHLGRLDESIAASERAIELQPDDPAFVEPYLNSALSYRRIGDLQRARARLQRAIELAPEHPSIANTVALVMN